MHLSPFFDYYSTSTLLLCQNDSSFYNSWLIRDSPTWMPSHATHTENRWFSTDNPKLKLIPVHRIISRWNWASNQRRHRSLTVRCPLGSRTRSTFITLLLSIFRRQRCPASAFWECRNSSTKWTRVVPTYSNGQWRYSTKSTQVYAVSDQKSRKMKVLFPKVWFSLFIFFCSQFKIIQK